MGTKENPGKFDCLVKVAPDEPFFTLRAKDPLAPTVVRNWAQLAKMSGLADIEKFDEAMSCADAMEAWLEAHPPTPSTQEQEAEVRGHAERTETTP